MAKSGNRGGRGKSTKSLALRGLPTTAEFASGAGVDPWVLPEPSLSYTATLAGLSRTVSALDFHFALTLPAGGRVINAVSIRLPLSYEGEFVRSLDAIPERLRRASERGPLEVVEPLAVESLEVLGSDAYTRKSARFCRVTTNDETSVLDFFWHEPMTEAKAQSRPDDRMNFTGVLTVVLDAATFKCLIDQLNPDGGTDNVRRPS